MGGESYMHRYHQQGLLGWHVVYLPMQTAKC